MTFEKWCSLMLSQVPFSKVKQFLFVNDDCSVQDVICWYYNVQSVEQLQEMYRKDVEVV